MTLVPENKASVVLKLNMGFGPAEGLERPIYIGDQAINEDYLVVYVDIGINVVFAINLDSIARFPIQLDYLELLSQIDSEQVVLFEMDWPKEALMEVSDAPQWRQDRARERHDVIKPLLPDLESVLRNDYGQKALQKVIEQSGRSKQFIYDSFYAYLRMGQRVLGLSFPMGKNTVHIPKTRELRVKQGRVNKHIGGRQSTD